MSERQFWGVAILVTAFAVVGYSFLMVILNHGQFYTWRYSIAATILFLVARNLMIGEKDKSGED